MLNLFLLISCNNDDMGDEPLPPATQSGVGTFACKVNGVSFIDESNTFFNAFYQFVDGGFYFGIAGEVDGHPILDQIAIGSNYKMIEENGNYTLECNIPDNHYAEVSISNRLLSSTTCETSFGNLSITKLDFENSIVSGEFEFDVIDPRDNAIIKIREGRFDTIFTQ